MVKMEFLSETYTDSQRYRNIKMHFNRLTFRIHGDKHGDLVALEELTDVPFHIHRVYYVYNTDADAVRGCHAHKRLQQVLICVHGSCKIKLDDGKGTETITLDKPYEGIYVSGIVWREVFDFSQDAVLLVLASERYDKTEYIRDYNEFLKIVNGENSLINTDNRYDTEES